jgi:hypothetical protein
LDLPPTHRYVKKFRLECNYLQAMEGDYDASHASFLHSTLDQGQANNPALQASGGRLQFAERSAAVLGGAMDDADLLHRRDRWPRHLL